MTEAKAVTLTAAPKHQKLNQSDTEIHYLCGSEWGGIIMRLKYLIVLLATALFVWPQVGYSQEDEGDTEYEDYEKAKTDSVLNLITADTPNKLKARYYSQIADFVDNPDDIKKYALLSLELCSETDTFLIGLNNISLARSFYYSGNLKTAIRYVQKNFDLLSENQNQLIVRSYYFAAYFYDWLGQSDSATYSINKVLEYSIRNNDTAYMTESYRFLTSSYGDKALFKEAEKNIKKAIELDSLANNKVKCAFDYHLYGNLINAKNPTTFDEYNNSINYLTKAKDIFESINYGECEKYWVYDELASSYIKIAKLTNNKSYADSCLYYHQKAAVYYSNAGLIDNYRFYQYNYVEYLIFYKRYREALDVLLELKNTFTDEADPNVYDAYHSYLKDVYTFLGDYKNALVHSEKQREYLHLALNDSTMNALAEMKTEQAMMIEKLDREKAEAIHAAEKQKMNIIIISLIGGLLLISLLVFFIFRALEIKKKANAELLEKNAILIEQKEEIQAQRDEIEEQKDEIETQRDEIMAQRDHIEEQRDQIEAQNKEIQASISYAQRIQRSLLTPSETISRIFPDHFLLYKPRNIVSGDYYWVGQFGDNKVCIVADCTGHGVPGGFMSVLGMSNLNHIVGQDITPDMILNRLREEIILNLRQSADAPTALQDSNGAKLLSDNTDRSRDGMDVAAYVVNERLMKLSYAGANNPLVLIRDNEVQVLKADKMPVGIYARLDPFQCTTIDLQKGDCLYTFSDGFQDQFGYESGKKFMSKRLRELLLEIHQRPMAEQKSMLNVVYEEWRGPIENQTDDVVIMGVRI